MSIHDTLLSPSFAHWFGTDALGRDLFFRSLSGLMVSASVGLSCAALSLFMGSFYGALAGTVGGRAARILMRFLDIAQVLPPLLVAMLVGVFLGTGFWPIVLAIALVSWFTAARLVCAEVQRLAHEPFHEAALALGITPARLFLKHHLPALAGSLLACVTHELPHIVLTESFLSFLGLGLQSPFSSLGGLASEGLRGFQSYPHLILGPGSLLFCFLFFFQRRSGWAKNSLHPKSNHDKILR